MVIQPMFDTLYTLFTNLYQLNGQFITHQKVTKDEKIELESNVKLALYNKYNSRNLKFGEAIDYYELVETIKNADPRIKDVNLNIPTLDTRVLSSNINSLTIKLEEDVLIEDDDSYLTGMNGNFS